jgi:hypothetical protein
MKNQRHTVAGRDLLESPGGGGAIELVRAADDFVEPVDKSLLFIRWADGITHDVDEENVRNLEADIGFSVPPAWGFNLTVDSEPLNKIEQRSEVRDQKGRKRPERPTPHVQVRRRV